MRVLKHRAVAAFRVVIEFHQSVAVVDFHLKLPESGNSEETGYLQTHVFAEVGHIEGHNSIGQLTQIREVERQVIS